MEFLPPCSQARLIVFTSLNLSDPKTRNGLYYVQCLLFWWTKLIRFSRNLQKANNDGQGEIINNTASNIPIFLMGGIR